MKDDDRDPRPLILWTIAMALAGVVVLYTLYLIRDVLLVLYVSGIFAIGFRCVKMAGNRSFDDGSGWFGFP